jgi:hypothetical protein
LAKGSTTDQKDDYSKEPEIQEIPEGVEVEIPEDVSHNTETQKKEEPAPEPERNTEEEEMLSRGRFTLFSLTRTDIPSGVTSLLEALDAEDGEQVLSLVPQLLSEVSQLREHIMELRTVITTKNELITTLRRDVQNTQRTTGRLSKENSHLKQQLNFQRTRAPMVMPYPPRGAPLPMAPMSPYGAPIPPPYGMPGRGRGYPGAGRIPAYGSPYPGRGRANPVRKM